MSAIPASAHEAFLATQSTVPFLQLPAWAQVKPDWRAESVGWTTADGRPAAVALVLYRRLPGSRLCLAYLPDGPVAEDGHDVTSLLEPLVAHVRARHAFAVRIGPAIVRRRWEAATIKAEIATGQARTVPDVAPDAQDAAAADVLVHLRSSGWHPVAGSAAGFASGQPRFLFRIDLAGRGPDDVFAALGSQWRRNIRTAGRLGVDVREGDPGDLATFHELYLATARRDGFTPRPLPYFTRLWQALSDPGPDGTPPLAGVRLYLAHHGPTPLAAALAVRAGNCFTYLYGGSADTGREFKGSNALQWRMLADAVAEGAAVYDLRGIGGSLEPDDPLFGLTRFKLGSGGYAVETVGEWELPIRRVVNAAVGAYLARR